MTLHPRLGSLSWAACHTVIIQHQLALLQVSHTSRAMGGGGQLTVTLQPTSRVATLLLGAIDSYMGGGVSHIHTFAHQWHCLPQLYRLKPTRRWGKPQPPSVVKPPITPGLLLLSILTHGACTVCVCVLLLQPTVTCGIAAYK